MSRVWEDTEEDLHDITPKQNKASHILFVEDANLKYGGKQIRNVRVNLTNNRLVDDWFAVRDAISDFNNRGERALLYDLTDILNYDQREHLIYLKELESMISAILYKKGTRDSLCLCKSRKKFKDCHRIGMESKVKRII